jgi:hypothetical protein
MITILTLFIYLSLKLLLGYMQILHWTLKDITIMEK